jgi:hypothetical protein
MSLGRGRKAGREEREGKKSHKTRENMEKEGFQGS